MHFGLLDKPDSIAGRSLPFVFDSITLDGAVDFDTSKGDDARQVRSVYPLYGGIQDYPCRDQRSRGPNTGLEARCWFAFRTSDISGVGHQRKSAELNAASA